MGFDLYGNSKNKKGEYFRNNVWWWRRLADYVCEYTGVVDEKDKKQWQFNDGHEVSKEEAEQIANQLEHLIKIGHAQKYADQVTREMKVAKATNAKVQKLFEKLEKKVEEATGRTRLAPSQYPKKYKDEWDKTYRLKDSRGDYPFTINNVKEFIEFCRNSNGFRID